MSSRVSLFRGCHENRRSPQGGRGGASRGRGGGAGGNSNAGPERKKRESILNLQQYVDTSIRIKFMGGREGQLVPDPRGAELMGSDGHAEGFRPAHEPGHGRRGGGI